MSMASKMVILVTGLFSVHCLNLYQNCLLTQLINAAPYEAEVHSFEDVIDKIERKEVLYFLTFTTTTTTLSVYYSTKMRVAEINYELLPVDTEMIDLMALKCGPIEWVVHEMW